jgi:stage V sporulation protein K
LTNTVTMKHKTQINVVLNQNKMNPLCEDDAFFVREEDREQHIPLEKIIKKMNNLVGMEELKKFAKEIYAWLYINKCRAEYNLKVEKQVLHMIFKGNPGTGKTTVARLLAELLHEMNVLNKGHLIEVERADLVGEYIGHTAQKTRELVKKAHGGILFIDEAYSLARGGEKDFGKEAIDTLVKAMEDKQHDFILILAGYSDEMDHFLTLNPGLPSRLPVVIEFPDYTIDELMEIGDKMLKERQYTLSKAADRKLRKHLQLKKGEDTTFSNGRYIRNIIEKTIRTQAVRLLREGKRSKEDLVLLQECDLLLDEQN